MQDKIIALVDGSIYAQSVCDHAVWLAERLSAPVELLHVLGRREATQTGDLSGSIKLGARSALLEELSALDEQRAKLVSQHGRAILEDASALLEKGGVAEVTERLRYGDLVEAVAEVEGQARLILIGKRGEAADFAKGHLGSNLERIVRASHKPVFVASRQFRPIQKLLLAYDGGASARAAVDYLLTSDLAKGLTLELVTVGRPSDETEQAMAQAVNRLAAAGLEASARRIDGQPEAALGKLVEDESFDMVVMGAFGHSRIRSLIIGSTTTAMVRACKVPILLVR